MPRACQRTSPIVDRVMNNDRFLLGCDGEIRSSNKIDEKVFDLSIFKAVQKLTKKYDIKYDKAHPVPSDDNLAGSICRSHGVLHGIGFFCLNTRRVIRFTEQEIRERLADLPKRGHLGEVAKQ